MFSRAPLLLCLLPACFTDTGRNPGNTPPQGADTTTAETDETTPLEPTSTSTGTTGTTDTTSAQTDTTSLDDTAMSSTGPACASDTCEPGEVVRGEACGACGVEVRTCADDCTLGPAVCDDPPDACAYWVLPGAAETWERIPRPERPAQFAPTGPVLGAFPLASTQQIVVLTASTVHVLNTIDRTWVATSPRDEWFPDISGLPLHMANAVTQPDQTDATITLVAGEDRFVYPHAPGDGVGPLSVQQPCCGPTWSTPDAPDFHAVRDLWSDLDDTRGWAVGDVAALCDLDEPTDVVGYAAVIADEDVHMQEIGHCFEFFPAQPYASFPPFTYPGAPPAANVGGAAWLDGLWIFPG